jgi:glycosyltransferase involved in cell wall biosynthesis
MPEPQRFEGTIAMVTGRYPGLSQTFIDREVRALREMGVDLITVTVRSPDPQALSGQFQHEEAGRVFRLLDSAKRPGHVVEAMYQALRHPRRLAATARLAIHTCPAGARAVALQLAYFAEAILLGPHLRTSNVKHLHNHLGDSSGTVTMLAAELTRIPFSMTLHGPEIFQSAQRWRLDAKVARAHFVACISEFGRQQAMRFSDEAHWHKLKVVRCGVNPSLYAAAPTAERTSRDLLFVGRLEERKGVDILLDAVALLKASGSDVRLKIVGNGPQREALQRQTAALSLAAVVTFAGTKDEAAVAEALRYSDVLVVPSLSEGLPVVIMEALASGVPVVASAVDGIPELVREGETGRLVPPSDPQALAKTIEQMLKDPGLRQRLGDAGRKLVATKHDAESNTLELLRLIASHEVAI